MKFSIELRNNHMTGIIDINKPKMHKSLQTRDLVTLQDHKLHKECTLNPHLLINHPGTYLQKQAKDRQTYLIQDKLQPKLDNNLTMDLWLEVEHKQ